MSIQRPNVMALQMQLTMTVGDLEPIAQLCAGAIDVYEADDEAEAPQSFYDIVQHYDSLMAELDQAMGDVFGVE